MYHRFYDGEAQCSSGVSPSALGKQIEYVTQHHPTIDSNQQFDEKDEAPQCAVVFTVDDGYRDFYTIAFPVFRNAGLPVTVFVATGFINGEYWFWWDRLRYLLEHRTRVSGTLQLTTDNASITIDLAMDDAKIWDVISDFLVALTPLQLQAALDDVEVKLGIRLPEKAPTTYRPFSWDEARIMQEDGVSFGAHTVNHPVLSHLSTKEVREEVTNSTKVLEREVTTVSRVFCFPHGQTTDYSPHVEQVVESCGFSGCYSAHQKLYDHERYSSPRYGVSEDMVDFKWKLCGAERLYARLAQSSFRRVTKSPYSSVRHRKSTQH